MMVLYHKSFHKSIEFMQKCKGARGNIMKKANNKSLFATCLSVALIVGVSGLTVFSSIALVDRLNADADMQYVAAFSEANASFSETMQNDRGNDNDDLSTDEPSNDGTSLVDQSVDDISSIEDTSVQASDTEVSADDSEAVTYPYYIGIEFVVVDPEGNMVYFVKKGDTLSAISGIVGYSVDELAEYNHIKNVNLIYTNESLRIPAEEDLIETVRKYIENQDTTDAAVPADGVAIDDGTLSQQN